MRLNLSYNHIVDLSGLKLLGTSGCRLSHLNLHGNKLSSLQHLHCCLTPLSILSDLTVNQDGSSNPFCVVEGVLVVSNDHLMVYAFHMINEANLSLIMVFIH